MADYLSRMDFVVLDELGYSKDYRPDLNQMILALVVDGARRPICTEMWPGNTADVTTLLPVVDRLRGRFRIGRVCVVADRGMISASTIAGLEERKLEYTRPIFHSSDAAIRGHVFCSFLALLMRAELDEIYGDGGVPEWSVLLREDADRFRTQESRRSNEVDA